MTKEERAELIELLATGKEIPLTAREKHYVTNNPAVSKLEFLQRLWLPLDPTGNPSDLFITVNSIIITQKDFWGKPVTFDMIVRKYTQHDSIYGKQALHRWLERERWNDDAKVEDALPFTTTAEKKLLELLPILQKFRSDLDSVLGEGLSNE